MPIRNVGDAMREMQAGSKHIKSRAQAIAVGLKAEGKSRRPKRQSRAVSHAKAAAMGGMGVGLG